jgi:TM2 domain-containing membrane protein YozV
MYCSNCGAEINDKAVVCIRCGCAVNRPQTNPDINKSTKDWLVTLLLCFFVGYLGVHRFYVGKTGTGIIQLITCGGCGIWTLIDFIIICMGNFTDSEGKAIKDRP